MVTQARTTHEQTTEHARRALQVITETSMCFADGKSFLARLLHAINNYMRSAPQLVVSGLGPLLNHPLSNMWA